MAAICCCKRIICIGGMFAADEVEFEPEPAEGKGRLVVGTCMTAPSYGELCGHNQMPLSNKNVSQSDQ